MRTFIAAVAVIATTGAAGVARAEVTNVGSLGLGDAVFWQGPFIDAAGMASPVEPLLCHGATGSTIGCLYATAPPTTAPVCLPDACIEYAVDVLDAGGTLRVALDHPTTDNRFSLVLIDPDGAPAAWAWNLVTLSVEARVPEAASGRWTIQVLLHSVERSDFRMRAYLEPPSPGGGDVVPLLPNLQVSPPFDLAFDGCQLSETIQHEPATCLRFSTGPNNVGPGPLDIRIRESGLSGPEVQRIHNSDGTYTERPAGTFEYHPEHAHYHHVGTARYQLYRVLDAEAGTLERVGDGPKIGFCLGDSLIAEWSSFAQEPQNGRNNECNGRIIGPPVPQVLEPALDFPMFSLSAGWGDSYTYTVEGNYVDFGANTDGLYLIQVATDPDDTILESSEDDNLGYGYFSVSGNTIEMIERGRGASPWDPTKVIADDIRRAVRPTN